MATSKPGEVRYPDTTGGGKCSGVKAQGTKGPVVDNIKSEISRTSDELQSLKNSSATDQQLTRYHSLLSSLLSWERPRATALSFVSVIVAIFAARYLPLLRWFFKFLYLSLGFTVVVEVAGKLVFSQGLVGSFRPRKYFTIPRETVEATLEDLQQLVDFLLIEFQRVLFAENILHTVTAFSAAFTAYWLIKVLPFWGLTLIAVTIAYLGPFIYIHNRELIDTQIKHAQSIVNSQAHQLRDLAQERTSHATGVVKQYVGNYSAKAHGYMGDSTKVSSPVKAEPAIKTPDFPEAPKGEPVQSAQPSQQPAKQEPLLA